MKNTYLYKLFCYSKFSFVLVVLFMLLYGVFFSRKMDMVLFPHNSMFAGSDTGYVASALSVKLNGRGIGITAFPYWKKDFMESASSGYARYLRSNNEVYLQQYFAAKNIIPGHYGQRLFPKLQEAGKWPGWLVEFAGYKPGNDAVIELYEYHFDFHNGRAVIIDSTLLFSQKTQSL